MFLHLPWRREKQIPIGTPGQVGETRGAAEAALDSCWNQHWNWGYKLCIINLGTYWDVESCKSWDLIAL